MFEFLENFLKLPPVINVAGHDTVARGPFAPSRAWRVYSWAVTAALALSMSLALYGEVPGNAKKFVTLSSNGVGQLFRADIFVFTVTVLNDAVAVLLLILANVKAHSTTEALNMLVFAERMAGALGRGSVWQRRVWLQVGLVLLGVFAYLGAVAFVVVLSESSAAEDSAAVADPNGRATELWGLAHISSLPLQLFFCLLFGDQVCLVWLHVRALNRRLKAICTEPLRDLDSRHHGDVQCWTRKPAPCVLTGSLHHDGRKGACAGVDDSLQDVHALRSLYSELRHTLLLLSSAHGLELLLMVLSTFLATTTSLYIRLTNRDDGSNLALAWSVLVATMLLVVLHAGELVKREVRSFSRQLLHQGLRVSVYGFLQLDYSMLQGMIGSVTTYLIMVIQLSPEENDSSEDVHAGSAATKT